MPDLRCPHCGKDIFSEPDSTLPQAELDTESAMGRAVINMVNAVAQWQRETLEEQKAVVTGDPNDPATRAYRQPAER
jgi:hypothetical protein